MGKMFGIIATIGIVIVILLAALIYLNLNKSSQEIEIEYYCDLGDIDNITTKVGCTNNNPCPNYAPLCDALSNKCVSVPGPVDISGTTKSLLGERIPTREECEDVGGYWSVRIK